MGLPSGSPSLGANRPEARQPRPGVAPELHSDRFLLGIALARGCHAVVVEWFNKTGGADLAVRWGRAGDALLPLDRALLGHSPVPADAEPAEEGPAPGDRARR